MFILYKEAGVTKEIEISAEEISIALAPQPKEGIFGIIVKVNQDQVLIKSSNQSDLGSFSYEELIATQESNGNLDPEDQAFVNKTWI